MACNAAETVAVFRSLFLGNSAPFLGVQNGCATPLVGNTVTFSGTIINMQGTGASVTFMLQLCFDEGKTWQAGPSFSLTLAPSYNQVIQLNVAARYVRGAVAFTADSVGATALIDMGLAIQSL